MLAPYKPGLAWKSWLRIEVMPCYATKRRRNLEGIFPFYMKEIVYAFFLSSNYKLVYMLILLTLIISLKAIRTMIHI